MLYWAAQDISRNRSESILLAVTIILIVLFVAIPLFMTHILTETIDSHFDEAPSLIIRKTNQLGWTPIPIIEGDKRARSVPGIIESQPRVWGIVRTPTQPVTIYGLSTSAEIASEGIPELHPGEALIGPAVTVDGPELFLSGQQELMITITGRLPSRFSSRLNDCVLLHESDARLLLDIPEGFASDIVCYVFHEEEEKAVLADLSHAFPWPVRIITRSEMREWYHAQFFGKGSIFMLSFLPAVFSLIILILANVRQIISRKRELGLLKALGWTTSDIVFVTFSRGLLIVIPALLAGLCCALWSIFYSSAKILDLFFYSGTMPATRLVLNGTGILSVVVEVIALIFIPCCVAFLWPGLSSAVSDPGLLIDAGE